MLSTSKFESYKSNENIAGMTYGQWTVKWWQWALSMAADENPVEDKTGMNASKNQPKDVWFLAGIFGKENSFTKFPTRSCRIPTGVPILIPVINCEADMIEYPHLRNDQDILNDVQRQANSIEKKECYINGELTFPERVTSDPQIFDITIQQDFTKEKTRDDSSHASADGYWVFLKCLPVGEYSIRFEGACEQGRIRSGANYSLTIF